MTVLLTSQMKYLGGKHRIGKPIVEVILSLTENCHVNRYVEPFCGSLGVMKNMIHHNNCCIGNDLHKDVIALWRALQTDSLQLPESLTREEYKQWKSTADIASEGLGERAAIGFGLSFGGKFFGGYASGAGRDFMNELKRSLIKLAPVARSCEFTCGDYRDVVYAKNDIIYCDIPYQLTTGWTSFNHEKFWAWAEKMSAEHYVFVSSEFAPDGWISVWERNVSRSVAKISERRGATEKLFIYDPK